MFHEIKDAVDIIDVISKELNLELKKIGESTYEPEDKECPFCGHKDSFRVKNSAEEKYYNCFSCGEKGDLITFVEKSRKLKPIEAAKAIAKEWNVNLPTNLFSIQEIFDLAANYYHTCFKESSTTKYKELNGLTPEEYQTKVRGHNPATLDYFKVGWSDGGLMSYFRALGHDADLLLQSGLMNKKGKDFLPSKVFIYPHTVNGKVSHFTFKDPLKQNAYQLPNTHKLNRHIFYNSDSLRSNNTVAIVEGENDVLSVHESGWNHGLIATIGQLSSQQSEWLVQNLKNKDVLTFFDNDNAGDKYREKLEAIKSSFTSLTQIKLVGHKDIDEYLVKGGKLTEAISANTISTGKSKTILSKIVEGDDSETSSINIVEKDGCYYRVKYRGDEPMLIKLTNFSIKLRNIFIRGTERRREVLFVRQDGVQSDPVHVDSDSKVSLKSFKVFCANAIDGSFYGQESDLTSMWQYVYSQAVEKIVHVPEMVGRLDQFKGWLFRDLFISDTGMVTNPDEEGIIWFPGKSKGLKPMSLTLMNDGKEKAGGVDMPTLRHSGTEEERTELLRGLVDNLCRNLGNPGMALTMLGWAKANVYSDIMFHKVQGFPFLFFWGKHGQGKTVIAKWLASIFNMDENGYGAIPQFKSGVGFGRKIAYYSSLPVIVDEVRADATTVDKYGEFRSWYQRASREMGIKDDPRIKQQPVRSNFIFAGQDQFTDTATRQRCISIRIPVAGREPRGTYTWIETHRGDLSQIGYHWILESSKVPVNAIYEHYDELDKQLVAYGCESRSAKNWACVGVFAKSLADEFMPKYDYNDFMFKAAKVSAIEEVDGDMVAQFFSIIEGMMASENSPITLEHVKTDSGKLYIWFRETFRLVQKESRGIAKENFTESAMRAALLEEKYCLGDKIKKRLGVGKSEYRTVAFDLRHPDVPESLLNIASKS